MNPNNNNPQEVGPIPPVVPEPIANQPTTDQPVSGPVSFPTPPEPKKSSPLILIAIVLVVIALLAAIAYAIGLQFGNLGQGDKNISSTTPQACTEEVKICDDGSSVGRTGPNCEFAECPIVNKQERRYVCLGNEPYKEENFKIGFTCEPGISVVSSPSEIIIDTSGGNGPYVWIMDNNDTSYPSKLVETLNPLKIGESFKDDLHQYKRLSNKILFDLSSKVFQYTPDISLGYPYFIYMVPGQNSNIWIQASENDVVDRILSSLKILNSTPSASQQ